MALAVLSSRPAFADTLTEARTTYGTLGLVEMPSSRMAADGTLSAGASFFQGTQRYFLNFQGLPWLEASLRYSGLRNFEPALPAFYEVYWDRSFAVKARLFREGDWFPEISVGLNDLIGTGVNSGEYVVATKAVGPVEATLGLGWGRLADTGELPNPFGKIFHSFNNRAGLSIAGGTDFNTLFHGPRTGVFGGLTWHTPVDGLSLSAEYSSDEYRMERGFGTFTPHNQINYGVAYQVSNSLSVGLDWLYGRSIGFTLSLQTDPTVPQYPVKMTPAPATPLHVRSEEEQQLALDTLLGKSDHAVKPGQMTARRLDRNAFVDKLFDTAAYVDVETRNGTLYLAAASGADMRPCAELVDLVLSYNAGVSNIVFESNKPERSQTCQVPTGKAALVLAAATPPATGGTEDRKAMAAIRADAARQDIAIEALRLTDSEAIVYYVNNRYLNEDDALNRLILVLMQDAPGRIEKFRLFAGTKQEFDVLRAPMERGFAAGDGANLLGEAITVNRPPLDNPVLYQAARTTYPRFSWNVFPQLRQSLFDPANPLGLQLVGALSGTLELSPGLRFNGQVETNIFQNIPSRPSDSLLPHVRSELPRYIHEGGTGLEELNVNYRFRLAPDVYAVARAGYLESMFAGVGGEVLWWPDDQRWALGGDLYEVKQRAFDRLFGFQHYQVTTGHISLYYQSPWYDINFILRAGQYLAGDRGVTFEATRRFSTGVEVGAFFTKTNVSAAQFGEGSFDKGIFIRIPLDWALPVETQGQFLLNLRPLQRDGGQPLANDATLFDELFSTNSGEIRRHADAFAAP